jgi:hypothetical protein
MNTNYDNKSQSLKNMECKHLKIKCVTRVINQIWEEMRACDCGEPCSYQNNPSTKVFNKTL